MPDTLSGHELLIRIDERVKTMYLKMDSLCSRMEKKVDDDSDYQAMEKKVDSLWDMKNKLVGWAIGVGVVSGTTVTLLKDLVSKVFAK